MRQYRRSASSFSKWCLWLLLTIAIPVGAETLPEVGTEELVGRIDGIDIVVKVASPSAQETLLQIVCLFEYVEGDIFTAPPALPKALNGMVHVDEALGGLITELRKSGKFSGEFLETLLIVPPKNTLPAKQLLLIGLGNRNRFKPAFMRLIGTTGMREALRLGVNSYSHASDLKDAGFDSPTADITGFVIKGALEAYRIQKYLLEKNASAPVAMSKITLLTGPAYFEDSKKGIKKTIDNLPKS